MAGPGRWQVKGSVWEMRRHGSGCRPSQAHNQAAGTEIGAQSTRATGKSTLKRLGQDFFGETWASTAQLTAWTGVMHVNLNLHPNE